MKYLLTPLLLSFFVAFASAEIYKWKDENGKLHYGDKVPNQYKEDSTSINANKLSTINFDNKTNKFSANKKREQTAYDIYEENQRKSDNYVRNYIRKQSSLTKNNSDKRKKEYAKNRPCDGLTSNSSTKWAKQLKEKCKADYMRTKN